MGEREVIGHVGINIDLKALRTPLQRETLDRAEVVARVDLGHDADDYLGTC